MISDPPHNDETKKSNKSAAQRKEEKRKAIQAARIQREKELAALLAQEQALLEGLLGDIIFFLHLTLNTDKKLRIVVMADCASLGP